jgi:hypothetical protein
MRCGGRGILTRLCRPNPTDRFPRVAQPAFALSIFVSKQVRTTVNAPQTTRESLEQARSLMRELIDRLQMDTPVGHAQTPASLLRILVHIANIQKLVDQSSEDPANAIKRLRDFANTIERLELAGENLTETRDLQAQLIAVLRLAADQL